jgi:hypothetical protein
MNEILADGLTTRCLIVGVNVDREDYPYSFLTVYDGLLTVRYEGDDIH